MDVVTEHNLGKLSDRTFDTLESAIANKRTSYTTTVFTYIINGEIYLSSTFKALIPIVGNRISFNNDEYFYLITDNQGKLTNKLRI